MTPENDILSNISFTENENNTKETPEESLTYNDVLNNIVLNENTQIQENNDILKELETNFFEETKEEISVETQEIIVETQEVISENNVSKKGNNILSGILFLIKYVATSSIIFVILLFSTNYSAYIEIARSYLTPEALETTKNSMYASINSTSLSGGTTTEEIIEEKEISIEEEAKIEEKMNMVKNKTYHSMDKLVGFNKEVPINIEITPYENRVVIPKIGKNIPLVEVERKTVKNVKELEDVFMKELVNGIVRYPGSAKPGQEGNSFIFGHSSNFPWLEGKYNDVFALLDNVSFGDEVIVYYDQKKYTYKITQKKVIRPGDTSVLKNTGTKKEISLMTCWPVGTTLNRMIVIGELVE